MVQKKLLHNVDQELLFFKFSTAVEHNSGGRVFFFYRDPTMIMNKTWTETRT